MNTAQAKKIPLREILTKLGLQPVKTFRGGEELAYLSPFRDEKEPSLFVNIRKNVWNDFGDIGGNALDFVMRYRNTDVKGGLEFLNQIFGKGFVIPSPVLKAGPLSDAPNIPTFILNRVSPFSKSTGPLITYITKERGINSTVAGKYLKEVHFTNRETGQSYFAAGFENLSGGYEIRNPFFKSSLGAKDMSLIPGNGSGEELYVFEGFMDFLSKLTIEGADTFYADTLVLNTAKYVEKSIKLIQKKGYKRITGFLDNDKTGSEATERFKLALESKFSDSRGNYQDFKDLNEFLKRRDQIAI